MVCWKYIIKYVLPLMHFALVSLIRSSFCSEPSASSAGTVRKRGCSHGDAVRTGTIKALPGGAEMKIDFVALKTLLVTDLIVHWWLTNLLGDRDSLLKSYHLYNSIKIHNTGLVTASEFASSQKIHWKAISVTLELWWATLNLSFGLPY
jgi:hypothetical protein